MSSVCIIAEHQDGKPKKSTLSAITFGRQAAEKIGAELCLIVIGNAVSGVADELKSYGASKIVLADDPGLENYTAETWSFAAAQAAKSCGAGIVGMSSGTTGKDMMPRVAVKLNAGMGSDVFAFDGENFLRGMWAGNAVAAVDIQTPVKVVTIQATAFGAAEPAGGDTPVEKIDISIPPAKTRFVEMRKTVSERPDPTEARVVVTGGRGVNGADNFKIIEQLADMFDGAVGATRAAAALNLARTITRRAERRMVELAGKKGEIVSAEALKYINRLSDFLFFASRYANAHAGSGDVLWRPGENR